MTTQQREVVQILLGVSFFLKSLLGYALATNGYIVLSVLVAVTLSIEFTINHLIR